MAETVQSPNVAKTYLDDWTEDLAKAATALGLGALTIVGTPSVVADGGATIVGTPQIFGGGTGVTFRLEASAVTTVPGNITVTISVELSNGDTDERSHLMEIRQT